MICRFCQQWNPDEAKRCCYCNNAADATEDRTAAPGVSAAQRGLAGSGPALTTIEEPTHRTIHLLGHTLVLSEQVWQSLVAVAVVAGLGLLSLIVC